MPVYITTPIYYVTDAPHLGHAYTTIIADTMVRYFRMRGLDARMLTGTDEHGEKVAQKAAEKGMSPKDYTDEVSRLYREAWPKLNVEPTEFIRTTDPDHETVVRYVWRVLEAQGDIYFGLYKGWYCVACEQHYPEKELQPGNLCPIHGTPATMTETESFFFRLGKYRDDLLDFYAERLSRSGRYFVEPESRMNEVRRFLDDLPDLSVSRPNVAWGIPVPEAPAHTIYVWLDALTNYFSAARNRESLAGCWSNQARIIHIMGKEITRFHAIYWPAFLMALGQRLPDEIIAHGWWTVDGEKMSKTKGNVVNPLVLAGDLGADAFRYYVLRESSLQNDGDFSHEKLLQRYNGELANDLGNLVNRTISMAEKWCKGTVSSRKWPPKGLTPSAEGVPTLVAEVERTKHLYEAAMEKFNISAALDAIWELVRATNTFIEHQAPWKVENALLCDDILWEALEACRVIGHLVSPIMPEKAAGLLQQIGTPEAPHWPQWGQREPDTFQVQKAAPLFPRISPEDKKRLLASWVLSA